MLLHDSNPYLALPPSLAWHLLEGNNVHSLYDLRSQFVCSSVPVYVAAVSLSAKGFSPLGLFYLNNSISREKSVTQSLCSKAKQGFCHFAVLLIVLHSYMYFKEELWMLHFNLIKCLWNECDG